jgi:pyruvate/2-oxoglutarate dehydrogenase complex dihydrolipoamide acyltransferase (E2) component
VFLLLAAVGAANGESLWSTDFRGYLSGSRGLAVGQSLVVQVDASSSLSFSSSSNDSKNLTLEFTGGQSGNLFSFLPQVRTGGTLTTAGKDSLSLKTQIPVVVTALSPDGSAQVQGTRTVAIQGKNESITITGSIPPGQIGQAGSINFSQLANARLTYTTFLASATNVLSPADLQTILPPAPAAPAVAAAPAPAAGATAAAAAPAGTAAAATAPAGAPAAAAAAPTPATQPGLTISDARKRQLLLLYLNRLVDVVFSQ